MLEKIEYVEKNGGALIYRCYGDGSSVELPSRLRGLNVRELADHCFAGEPSFRYPKTQIQSIGREEWEREASCLRESKDPYETEGAGSWDCREISGIPAMGGRELREIFLPDTLEGIGDYAFYGCLNLERIHFPAGLKRLGGGAFVACNHIRRLYFAAEEEGETPYCMKDVLSELPYEVEAILENREGKAVARLAYPEYYEESKENTPARIIEIVFHGTGYKYRQCFQGRRMDFHQYDALFYLASVQEFPPTVVRLAVNRLETPAELSGEAEAQYLSWLRKEYQAAADWLFEQNRPELFSMLGERNYYTEEILEFFLETASARGNAAAASYLMDYRRSRFGAPAKKKYVL